VRRLAGSPGKGGQAERVTTPAASQDQIPGLDILNILLAESADIYQRAIELATEGNRRITGTLIMFSGGNDSSTAAHLFRGQADAAVHCNTGIGIEDTRQYVRDTCQSWGLRLIEKHVQAGETYRDLILGKSLSYHGGFPAFNDHGTIFYYLKQKAIRQVRAQYVTDHRKQRVIFISGIRRPESHRRRRRPAIRRDGSAVWCDPLINWSRLDLNEYRRRNPDMPRNEVADNLHRSGECLCGAFADPGELDEIGFWYPEVVAYIHTLEAEAKAAGYANCRWGGGEGSPCEGICNV
jgi:3'-phosphoadenosine 5'-phosphosulfate sulfotransferase (PAPS reductase)/FAD synthetase